MIEFNILLVTIATTLSLGGHIPYFIDILKGHTRPHIYSWSVWTVLLTIGLVIQITEGVGVGTWVLAGDTAACLITVILCLRFGTRDITRSDSISFMLAIIGVVLWVLTSNPLWAAILIVIADALGFFPTFRKSFRNPQEETALAFFLIATGFFISFFTFESYSLAAILYPAYLLLANGTFFVYLLVRRTQLARV